MDDLLGPDPLLGRVPPQLGHMAERHILDVDQYLILALAVPDLMAGVAGVGQDGAYRALRPGDAAAVPVAGRVVRGRARDAVPGESLGDGEQALPGEELDVDTAHDRRGLFAECQPV